MADRRTFLRLALVTPFAGRALLACGANGGEGAATFGDVPAGNVSATSVGSLTPVPNAPAFLGRDAGGLYAMTTTCTHQACDLASQGTIANGQITCGCHGSVYTTNGAVVKGPAPDPLQHFAVSVDAAGAITVHGGQPVGADARTSV